EQESRTQLVPRTLLGGRHASATTHERHRPLAKRSRVEALRRQGLLRLGGSRLLCHSTSLAGSASQWVRGARAKGAKEPVDAPESVPRAPLETLAATIGA